MTIHIHPVSPWIAVGVLVSTAATDAVYVMFNAAVTSRRRTIAASWSSLWYLLAAFAVISYTGNAAYVLFAAAGSWIGAFGAVTWLRRGDLKGTRENVGAPEPVRGLPKDSRS